MTIISVVIGAKQTHKSKIPLYLSTAIVVAVVISYFTIPQVNSFLTEAWTVLTSQDEKRIEEWVSQFGWAGPVVIVLAMIVQMFLIIIPSVALMLVAILAYGPYWGTLICIIAIYTASSIGFLLGKSFGAQFIDKLIGESSEEKLTQFVEDYGFWAIVVTRLNPFLSNDAISFVAGILKMGYWRFISATLLGILPLTIALAILGENNDLLQKGLLIGSGISLALFGAYVYWDKKIRKE